MHPQMMKERRDRARGGEKAAYRAGSAAVAGGLMWVGFYLWFTLSGGDVAWLRQRMWVLLPSLLLLAASLWFMAQLARAGSSRFGHFIAIAGLGLMSAGAGATIVNVEEAWLVGILGEMVLSAGLLMFGVANVQERLLPALNGLPLLIFLLYVPSWMVNPSSLPPTLPRSTTEWLAIAVGAGWIALGGLLLARHGERAPGG